MNVLSHLAAHKAPPRPEPWPEGPSQELVTQVIAPPDGQPMLACFARRTYALSGGKLRLADVQTPLLPVAVAALDPSSGEAYLAEDSDLLAPKPATDVIVTGSAFSASPVSELLVAVAVGSSARRLRVVGARVVDVTRDGQVTFSDPVPFEETELSPRLAYGGCDLYAQNHAERRRGVLLADLPPGERPSRAEWLYAYPRNPVGLGFFLDRDRERASGAMLPRIEDPADLLTPERFFVPSPRAWLSAPVPGWLGWLGPDVYPRSARVIGAAPEHDAPSSPERESTLADGADLVEIRRAPKIRFHERALQGATPGLAAERLRGDEVALLTNLRSGEPQVRFALPGEVPVFRLTPPGLGEVSPAPILQTVRIDTARGEVSLTWCGAVRTVTKVPVSFLRSCRLDVAYRKV